MKFAITTDTHVHFLRDPEAQVRAFRDEIYQKHPQAFLHLGDIGEGQQFFNPAYQAMVEDSLYVLGNHDLWRRNYQTPPLAMNSTLKMLGGTPLETKWEDTKTIKKIKDCTFVGSIGFPDFKHPALKDFEPEFWELNPRTNDTRFIDITAGWLAYTIPLQNAFFKRLRKAFKEDTKSIVIATHYPILSQQTKMNMSYEEKQIWPFFFNWTIGQYVLKLAENHIDKKVFVLSGHSHEYCSGRVDQILDNLFCYGMTAEYDILRYKLLDTDWDFQTLQKELND